MCLDELLDDGREHQETFLNVATLDAPRLTVSVRVARVRRDALATGQVHHVKEGRRAGWLSVGGGAVEAEAADDVRAAGALVAHRCTHVPEALAQPQRRLSLLPIGD